ncbi:MAG TPA: hypothetical protein VMF62_14940 [Acetobacteraceae bacterium]|nr:hypothetical protein [Acetobacteraceae bacterium]
MDPHGPQHMLADRHHGIGRKRHRCRPRAVRPYEYQDAASLLADFWQTVDAVSRERGVIP